MTFDPLRKRESRELPWSLLRDTNILFDHKRNLANYQGKLPQRSTNSRSYYLKGGGGEPVKKLCTTTAPSAISDANVGDMSWPKVIIR